MERLGAVVEENDKLCSWKSEDVALIAERDAIFEAAWGLITNRGVALGAEGAVQGRSSRAASVREA